RDRGAECGDVHGTIRCAAWKSFCVFMSQDENRGFSRDPANVAIDKTISNRVANYQYSAILKVGNYFSESLLGCGLSTQVLHSPRIDWTACNRLSQTRSGWCIHSAR